MVDIMGISCFTKDVYTYLFTMKEYITVQLTSTVQRH